LKTTDGPTLDVTTARQVSEEIDLLYNPPMAPSLDPLIIACSQAAKRAGTARR
jgi:hypothetical protein